MHEEQSRQRREVFLQQENEEFRRVHPFVPFRQTSRPPPPPPPPREIFPVGGDETDGQPRLLQVPLLNPVDHTPVFERLYSLRKAPVKSNISQPVKDDESLVTLQSDIPRDILQSPLRYRRARPNMDLRSKEDKELQEHCTFKPVINPSPFISQKSIQNLLDIVNPRTANDQSHVVSVIVDNEVDEIIPDYNTVYSKLVQPGLPVYYYNRQFPPLKQLSQTVSTVDLVTNSNIPLAPPMPPEGYFTDKNVTDVAPAQALVSKDGFTKKRAESNAEEKTKTSAAAPDWSSLLMELTTKIGGGLMKLNKVAEKEVKKLKLNKGKKGKKGKKFHFENIIEELKHFQDKLRKEANGTADSSESEEEEEEEPPPEVKSSHSNNERRNHRNRTTLIPLAESIMPAGAHRQMKLAVAIGISKIPPPPPLPGYYVIYKHNG